MIRTAARWTCALAWLGTASACGVAYRAEDTPSVDGGSQPTTPVPTVTIVDDAGAPAPPELALYVSGASGNDANDGVRERPFATIHGALGVLRTRNLRGYEIRICAGAYREATLSFAGHVTIRGGYNCSTWARTSAFGAPSFDRVNETRIENIDGLAGAAVSLSEEEGASPTLEGVTAIAANVSDGSRGVAVTIEGAAVLTDCIAQGGEGKIAVGNGSAGVHVRGGAPTIVKNRIHGGAGVAPGVGSIGVQVELGAPKITDNTISGGGGTGATGAIGLYIQTGSSLVGESAVTKNRITWDRPSSAAQIATGISAFSRGSIELISNEVAGGGGTCTSDRCMLTGANVSYKDDVTIRGNTIDIGAPAAAYPSRTIDAVGLLVSSSFGNVVITQNVIAGAFLTRVVGVRQSWAFAMTFCNSQCAITHNTFFSGFGPDAESVNGAYLPAPKGGTFSNNLLIGQGLSNGFGLNIEPSLCNGPGSEVPPLAEVKGNAFIGFPYPGKNYDNVGTAYCRSQLIAFEEWERRVDNPVSLLCPGNSPTGCYGSYVRWTSELAFRTDRFALKSGAPCSLAQGGAGLSPAYVATDFAGTPRTLPRSSGAFEQDVCTP